MPDGKTLASTRIPGSLRFVLALWAVALLLLALQAMELKLFVGLGG